MIEHLIFVSLEDWDEIWRRNQFVCAKLVERNPDLKILFVQPAFDVSNAVRTGRFGRLRGEKRAENRIVCTRALKLLPNSWTWARKFNEWMQRRHVRGVARQLGFVRPVLWLNAHSAVHMLGKMEEVAVIYDVTDDWTQFSETPAAAALTKEQDRELCQSADAVIVCSERLHELKVSLARKLFLIPNGVDAAHYARASDERSVIPQDARGWKSPVLGYTGTVHPERVDVSLVEAIARRLPECTLVFVGPLMLPPADLRRLQLLPNIVLAGSRPYARIPEYVRAFDICMTPHVVTPFTESLNPIKLWDYLAVGKPILSTPVAGFRDYPALVYLASDAEGFADAVGEAFKEDLELPGRRRAEAAKHSWESRVEAIEAVLAGCAPSLIPSSSANA